MAESYSKEMHAMPKKSNKPAKVMEHMIVTPGNKETGGVTVAHHFTHYDHKPEMHVFGKEMGKEFHAHMAEHSGMKQVEMSEDGGDKDTDTNEPEE